ncbi:MAG: MoxR family ATPase [Mogibacterium sp.]|nr:MoxR family ATPase [Mogibacterium sp.]
MDLETDHAESNNYLIDTRRLTAVEEKTIQAIHNAVQTAVAEMNKVIIGKEDVVRKVMMCIMANGHILIDDVPGVGKTSLAVAVGKVLGIAYNRIQFTPDVLPSDIVGFTIYNKETDKFTYMPGIINDTNLLLADEINRTSSRTQAALLEAMEEKQVTVDGKTYRLKDPFIVIATQNQVGTAGTQILPHAQMDRFLARLTIGYPDKDSEMKVIKERQTLDPYAGMRRIMSADLVSSLQAATLEVTLKDEIVAYITDLVTATREDSRIELGISPRGSIAVSHMAKACALMNGRDYVTEDDVREVFCDVCAHRIILTQKSRAARQTAAEVLGQILKTVKGPYSV